MDRRRRQFRLFLAAVGLPVVLLSLLTIRFVRQEGELAGQRREIQRIAATEQARRELTASLEAIQIREVNRRILDPDAETSSRPQDPALVFVTSWDESGMALPWESADGTFYPSAAFSVHRSAAERLEFQAEDQTAAAAEYRLALEASRRAEEACEARLGLGRALIKAEKPEDAAAVYREMLSSCGRVRDESGMPFALYAAERLIAVDLDVPLSTRYLARQLDSVRLRPLAEATMIRSLLEMARDAIPAGASQAVEARIADIEQVLAIANDFRRIRTAPEGTWLAYATSEERLWLLRVTKDNPPGESLVFAVSGEAVTSPGTKLVAEKTESSLRLEPGFSGLEIEFDPAQFEPAGSIPVSVYAVGLALVFALAVLGGYLLLHGVNRDLQMAEMRSHFVASVSHELKTPLTAIRMFAETLVLGRTRDDVARSEYLETIMNESERLARLVDNVLDFSKIEQGKKIYRMRPTALPDVVRSAARAMQYPLAQHGFRLDVSIDDSLRPIEADADAMEQAILNLLSNAMKYSGAAREIHLSCAGNGSVVIAVTDRGIGIAESDFPRIFDKFYRVRSSQTEFVAGTGLGLTLVQHIAQAHGGSVEVESVPGKGSTFTIRIPAKEEAAT